MWGRRTYRPGSLGGLTKSASSPGPARPPRPAPPRPSPPRHRGRPRRSLPLSAVVPAGMANTVSTWAKLGQPLCPRQQKIYEVGSCPWKEGGGGSERAHVLGKWEGAVIPAPVLDPGPGAAPALPGRLPSAPSTRPGTPEVRPPRSPYRSDTNIRLIFQRFILCEAVKVLGRIYRQNIWFVKTELPEKEKQTSLLRKCTFKFTSGKGLVSQGSDPECLGWAGVRGQQPAPRSQHSPSPAQTVGAGSGPWADHGPAPQAVQAGRHRVPQGSQAGQCPGTLKWGAGSPRVPPRVACPSRWPVPPSGQREPLRGVGLGPWARAPWLPPREPQP